MAPRVELLSHPEYRANPALNEVVASLQSRIVAPGNGRTYLKIGNMRPVSEPLLGLRVRIHLEKITVTSDYTLLLDLPVQARRRSAARTRSQTRRSSTPPAAPPAVFSGGDTYGPVESGETLWKIAMAVRPDASIRVRTMLQALHGANPDAFVNNNIDRLKLGATLIIPTSPAPELHHRLPPRQVASLRQRQFPRTRRLRKSP